MPDYLVESYQPTGGSLLPPRDLGPVRRVRSLHVPQDEVSLHVFHAPSQDAVREALDLAAFPYERIVEAVTADEIEKEEG